MLPNRENKKGAAIDMGTNTFHILIAEEINGRLNVILRKRIWVNLAESGITNISDEALFRAWEALVDFRSMLNEFKEIEIRAVATEAFRSADNGMAFLEKVKSELYLEPQIISGIREAELIYKGISLIAPGNDDPSLIMDIGGGSTEFILYSNNGIIWSNSYRAGVTFLFNQFAQSDPLSDREEELLESYFRKIFSDLLSVCSKYQIEKLIGASGSFEVLELLSGNQPDYRTVNNIDINEFNQQYSLLRNSNKEQRLAYHIPENRARMIVVAMVLMRYIVVSLKPRFISISPYAMKEGIIMELLKI